MHLQNRDIKDFQDNTMNTEETIRFLEHLDRCSFCMERFLEDSSRADAPAPRYLKNRILLRASQPDVRASKAAANTSRRLQLLYYSLHTAAGVAAALFLLFSLGSTDLSVLLTGSPGSGVSASQEAVPSSEYRLDRFSRKIGRGLSENTESISAYLEQISNFLSNGGR